MTTKAFVLLLAVVLALGGSLGVAFAGGVALGKSQGKQAAQSTPRLQPTAASGQQAQGQLTQEQLQQLRQQFQGQTGQAGRTGVADGGGLSGTVDKVEGNTVTVNTAQGPLTATIGADTTIQRFAVGAVADLKPGLQVTVVGQRGTDGAVTARSIVITPEGAAGMFGGGAFGGRQQPGQQTPTP